jgi:hypothetical protein
MNKRFLATSIFLFGFLGAYNENPPEKKDTLYEVKRINNTAFTFGEKLAYRVHYGPLNGGMAYFSVDDKAQMVNNRPVYYIKVHGKSAGLVDMMFKVKDEYESYLDIDAIIPWKSTKKVREGKYTDSDFITFDHERRKAISKRGALDIEALTQDVVSAIYYARTTDMTNAKVGDIFPVNFYLDGKNYQLRFKFEGRDIIETEGGSFKTLRIRPQLIEGRVFKSNDALTLWVTDDENKIPVRAESAIFVGSIKADLIEWSGIRNPLTSKIK